ncbi:MAG: FecR domain-containing protein [Bdellovibrionales bacterium]|jgi:hypothetical protein|nr:FecR domain-containing protein [Bdellovibrionales bacterium]
MKIYKLRIVFLILTMFCMNSTFSKINGVAKVIVVRGEVLVLSGSENKRLSKGDWVNEGDVIETAKSSFTRLLFKDKNVLNVGPKSKMKITSYENKKKGLVNLIHGQIRAKVKKINANQPKGKIKFIVKTRVAALGVRGTDFQATFNPSNNISNLITFEGEVLMKSIDGGELKFDNLTKELSQEGVVKVLKGNFSTVNQKLAKSATVPTKLNPSQFNALKGNTSFGTMTKQETTMGKTKTPVRAVVPPGMSSKDSSSKNEVLDTIIKDKIGPKTEDEVQDLPKAEGEVNKETGAITPPAGGFIDLKTGVYVAPAVGSTFDENTKTYTPPASLGTINIVTGEYQSPEGFELNDNGTFSHDENSPNLENIEPPKIITTDDYGSDSWDEPVENEASSEVEITTEDLIDEDCPGNVCEEFDNAPETQSIDETVKVKFEINVE